MARLSQALPASVRRATRVPPGAAERALPHRLGPRRERNAAVRTIGNWLK
jgi:hypothetical protein